MSVVCFLHPVLVWHAVIPGKTAPAGTTLTLITTVLLTVLLDCAMINFYSNRHFELSHSGKSTGVGHVTVACQNVSFKETIFKNIYTFWLAGTMLLVTAFFNFILSKKSKTNKSPKRPQESQSDQGPTTVCVTEAADSDSNFSFLHMAPGRRGGGLALATRDRSLSPGERGESVQAMLELEQQTAATADRERRRWRERRLICFRGSKEEPVEREMEEMDCYNEPDTTSDTAPMITDWTPHCAQTELLTAITQRRGWAGCSSWLRATSWWPKQDFWAFLSVHLKGFVYFM